MSQNAVYAGIDPGFTGAIAFIDSKGVLIALFDAPTKEATFIKKGKKRTRHEFVKNDMVNVFKQHAVTMLAIERVASRPKQGTTSMFRFGHGLGLWEGIAAGLSINTIMPLPSTWKSLFNLKGKEKDAARVSAIVQFPTAELHLKKHQGRADALWLAEYARLLVEKRK